MEEDYDMHDELDADVSPEDAVFTLHSQPIPIHLHKELSKGARHAIANKIKVNERSLSITIPNNSINSSESRRRPRCH